MYIINYQYGVEGLGAHQFSQVRQEWTQAPTASLTLASLRNMNAVVVALNEEDQVIGFLCGMTDQLLILYLWDFEVIEAYEGQGIEESLLERMLKGFGQLYQVNAHPALGHSAFFAKAGFKPYSQEQAQAMTRMDMRLQSGVVMQEQ